VLSQQFQQISPANNLSTENHELTQIVVQGPSGPNTRTTSKSINQNSVCDLCSFVRKRWHTQKITAKNVCPSTLTAGIPICCTKKSPTRNGPSLQQPNSHIEQQSFSRPDQTPKTKSQSSQIHHHHLSPSLTADKIWKALDPLSRVTRAKNFTVLAGDLVTEYSGSTLKKIIVDKKLPKKGIEPCDSRATESKIERSPKNKA
jgi:hypothetical protein